MEFLSKLALQTKAHLAGLSLSHRLAIGSCAALIVVSLLWLGNWAAAPVMVPLLDQPMTAQELTPIQQRLDALGIQYKLAGDTILIPQDKRHLALGRLGENRLLPDDLKIGFTKLMEDSSPWLSNKEKDEWWSVALGNELAKVIREFDGVQYARVIIDKSSRRVIGQPVIAPTASVFVKLGAGSSLENSRVQAIASLVSSAVAGLNVHSVSISDSSGRSYNVPRPEDRQAFDDLDDRANKEQYFTQKIQRLLANIPGLLVAVHAELDPESRRVTKEEHGQPVLVLDKTETTTEERNNPRGGPGVVPNTAQAIAAGGAVDKSETSKSEATYDGKVDTTLTTSEMPRHEIKSLAASINVPRSYLAAIIRQASGTDPSDEEIDAAPSTSKVLKNIEEQVKVALQIGDANAKSSTQKVTVKWFHDDAVMAMAQEVMEAGATPHNLMAYAQRYGSKAALGTLAAMGLMMMLLLVRRVGEGPVLPGEQSPHRQTRKPGEAVEQMAMGNEPVGEAEVTESLLVGREIDEHTMRTQKVVEQVNELVKEDTDGAVTILKRWIDMAQQ